MSGGENYSHNDNNKEIVKWAWNNIRLVWLNKQTNENRTKYEIVRKKTNAN